MQYKLTFPAEIKAVIQLPSSKSISNRALIIHALAGGRHLPANLSDCDDTKVMVKALAERESKVIDIMAAGTAMRFLTAYLSVTPGTYILTGTERMHQRPIRILVDALRELGAAIEYVGNEGYPPLCITGKRLAGRSVELKGDVSSQYISALLMIAPVLEGGLRLVLTGGVISRPYIDLTLRLMKDFGVDVVWETDHVISVEHQAYTSVPFAVESDWSAASYWYQIAALSPCAEIELPGLLNDSYQGDSRGAELFSRLGVNTTFTSRGVQLAQTARSAERMDEDMSDIPDLAQTFVVTCALLDVPFHLTGLQTLKIKETDRITALITEMAKLGYVIRQQHDSELIWDGERTTPQPLPVIRTYEDHRMAMAFAPAAIRFPELRIAEPQVVTKSYPDYWNDLGEAGVIVRAK